MKFNPSYLLATQTNKKVKYLWHDDKRYCSYVSYMSKRFAPDISSQLRKHPLDIVLQGTWEGHGILVLFISTGALTKIILSSRSSITPHIYNPETIKTNKIRQPTNESNFCRAYRSHGDRRIAADHGERNCEIGSRFLHLQSPHDVQVHLERAAKEGRATGAGGGGRGRVTDVKNKWGVEPGPCWLSRELCRNGAGGGRVGVNNGV